MDICAESPPGFAGGHPSHLRRVAPGMGVQSKGAPERDGAGLPIQGHLHIRTLAHGPSLPDSRGTVPANATLGLLQPKLGIAQRIAQCSTRAPLTPEAFPRVPANATLGPLQPKPAIAPRIAQQA